MSMEKALPPQIKYTSKGCPANLTYGKWARAQSIVHRYFETRAQDRSLVTYAEFFTGVDVEPSRPGTREWEAGRLALRALYSLDLSLHAAGLPIFSVLIEFKRKPPAALLNLLRELGLIQRGQSMEEIINVIERERRRTWEYYGAEGLW